MRITMHTVKFMSLCILLSLTGCQFPSTYEPPPVDIPEEWHSPKSEEMCATNPDHLLWWQMLEDPLLDSLMERAAQKNLDLFIAGSRILQAREVRQGKSADNYPHVDASVTAGHVCYSKEGLINGILGGQPHRGHSFKRNINFFEIGFDADWELDFFGVNAHAGNALDAKVVSAKENLCDIWVSLSAEVARNYIELRSLQQREQLLERHVKLQNENIHLMHQLLAIGDVSAFEILQAENELNTLLTQKPALEAEIAKAIHRISILLGQPPGDLFAELNCAKTLPIIPEKKPIGIPAEILRRRPDIRKAEQNLQAASESVASAVAMLFPRISLYGFVGQISTQLSALNHASNTAWFGAPQLLLPIFNSRLLTQNVNLNKIQAQEALFEYQKTVLLALEEVENGIASFHYEEKRQIHLFEIRKNQEEAYELAFLLFNRGIKDYFEVLRASRSFLSAEEDVLRSETQLLLHYISLYKALGGGWDVAQCAGEEEQIPTGSTCASLN